MRGHPGPQHSLNAAHPTAFRVPPRLSRGSPDEVSGQPFQAEPVSWSEKSSSSLTPQESLPDTMIVLQRSVSPTSSGHPFVGAVEGGAQERGLGEEPPQIRLAGERRASRDGDQCLPTGGSQPQSWSRVNAETILGT